MNNDKPSHSSSHSHSHSHKSSSSHSKPTHKSSYPDSKPYDGGYVSTSTYLKNRKTGSWPSSSENKEKGGVLAAVGAFVGEDQIEGALETVEKLADVGEQAAEDA